MISRRRFVAAATIGAFALPIAGRAQQPLKEARIGVFAGKPDIAFRDAFVSALRVLGWVEGRNLAIDWRPVAHPDEISAHAADLARLRPHVIVTAGPRISQAMAKVTSEIPIVFLAVGDPEKIGLVRSLPRPGGNVTGLRTVAGEGFAGKLIELLREASPRVTRIGVFNVTGNSMHQLLVERAKTFESKLRVSVVVLGVQDEKDIEPAFDRATRERVDALIVPGDVIVSNNRDRIVALALRHRMPTMFSFSYYADAGGLLAYGVDVGSLYRDAARLADKILRGARPQDIPVEQPTRFELVINLKTARALGLAIPQTVLLRADRVIE